MAKFVEIHGQWINPEHVSYIRIQEWSDDHPPVVQVQTSKSGIMSFYVDQEGLESCDWLSAAEHLMTEIRLALSGDETGPVTPELIRQQSCLHSLLGYVTTCREVNTKDWMDGLRRRINLTLESIGDGDRVEVDGDGLTVAREQQKVSEVYDCGCEGTPGNRCPFHDGP